MPGRGAQGALMAGGSTGSASCPPSPSLSKELLLSLRRIAPSMQVEACRNDCSTAASALSLFLSPTPLGPEHLDTAADNGRRDLV